MKKKRSEGCADDLIDLSMLEEGLSLGTPETLLHTDTLSLSLPFMYLCLFFLLSWPPNLLGRMAKVIILVLIKLKRLATVHVSGKTFYKIVSGANA